MTILKLERHNWFGKQRRGIIRSARRCLCILSLLYSAYLWLEALEFDTRISISTGIHSINSGTRATNRQNTSSPKYNDDIILLLQQYLISASADLHPTHGTAPPPPPDVYRKPSHIGALSIFGPLALLLCLPKRSALHPIRYI